MATKKKSTSRVVAAKKKATRKKPVSRKVVTRRKKATKRPQARIKSVAKKKATKRISTKRTARRGKRVRAAVSRVTKRVKAVRAKAKPKHARAAKKTKRLRSVTRRAKKTRDTVLLETLCGSVPRARMLRLFLREPAVSFDFKEVAMMIGVPLPRVRREATILADMGILSLTSRGGKRRAKVVPTFPFMEELQRITMGSFPIAREELLKAVKSAGRVTLVVVGGVFLNDEKGRVDLLVVADKYSEKRLARAVKKVEQSLAVELRWAGMDTKDFQYRWKMFDRFVRDIFARPHERVLQKIKL